MAVGLGPYAGNRLRVGRCRWTRGRMAAYRGRTESGRSAVVATARQIDGLNPSISYRELDGPGAALSRLLSHQHRKTLTSAVLEAASRRIGRRIPHVLELGKDAVLALPPEEQYLVSTGRTYFRDFSFDQLRRMQFDLETTGLDPERDRIFMIAVRDPSGATEVLESASEADLIRQLVAKVRAADPDVIENHNLHGFDLPFLQHSRANPGRPSRAWADRSARIAARGARRGTASSVDATRRIRFVAPGRELIDTLDAVLHYDFSARELPGHGLKAVARRQESQITIANRSRAIRSTRSTCATLRGSAAMPPADVEEVAHLARILGGAAFALAPSLRVVMSVWPTPEPPPA